MIIPPKFQTKVVNVLHEAHPGIVRMKSMSRSYVWWPKLDSAIEETVKACRQCVSIRASPLVAPLTPWTWPSKPWKRVHVDFASHEGNHYLVVVDAHSKWPEVIGPMKITSAEATINALRCIFGRYGLPEQVVSDNGPPFQSAEYDDFLRQNGIKRVLVSPYHPASNGQAERFVQTFKNFLKTANSQSSLLQRIRCFLLNYRSTPHTTTGCSPAKLFLQREVRTRLSLVKPDTASVVLENQSRMKSYHDQYAKFREFEVGQSVLARDYRSKTKWQLGTISERNGPHSYTVALPDGRIWKRHVDQLLKDSPSKVQQAEPIPSNLGNQREPQDLSVPSTSSIPSTPSPPTESTPSPPTVPQERTQNHPSEVTQDASITIESPAIKLRRSSRTIKQPKRLIDEIANT